MATAMWHDDEYDNAERPQGQHDVDGQAARYNTRHQARLRQQERATARRNARSDDDVNNQLAAGVDAYDDRALVQQADPVNNDRLRQLLDDRPPPQFSSGAIPRRPHRDQQYDFPQRSRSNPVRHTPDWDAALQQQRPFSNRLPERGEEVNPHTSHGRYMANLYKRIEDRERSLSSNRGHHHSDTDSVRSFNLNYAERPTQRPRVTAPALDDDTTQLIADLRRQLDRQARRIDQLEGGADDRWALQPRGRDRYRDDDDDWQPRRRHVDMKNLKIPKFNGKDFAGFKVAFVRCAKLLQWDEEQSQTQLLCVCEGAARNVIMTLPEGTSVVDMLHALELRYGINMSFANVDNKLVDIRRKPGESLHSLYDRVMALARRADYTPEERASKARFAFFQALRTDPQLQHYVGRKDIAHPPSIDLTLALALQYEMDYGRQDAGSTATSCNATSVRESDAPSEVSDVTDVNKLSYTSLKTIKDPTLRQLGKQQNEIIEIFKNQTKILQDHFVDTKTAQAPPRQQNGTQKRAPRQQAGGKPQRFGSGKGKQQKQDTNGRMRYNPKGRERVQPVADQEGEAADAEDDQDCGFEEDTECEEAECVEADEAAACAQQE